MVYFKKDGKAEGYIDIKNAFRGAMAIWTIIEEKYLPTFRPSFVPEYISNIEEYLGFKPSRIIPTFNEEEHIKNMHEIWDLFNSDKVNKIDRIVLGTTFDRVLVKRENFEELISAFENFNSDTSLKEQAGVIKGMLKNKEIIAVGWNQTSICSNQWIQHKYNEENDEYEPYNCLTGENHFWLFDGLK